MSSLGGWYEMLCHNYAWGWSAGHNDAYLNRGWCGNEHLPMFGLYNLNAHLYAPDIGRFLWYRRKIWGNIMATILRTAMVNV